MDRATLKESFLCCDICVTEYDMETHIPRILPCGHILCQSCLEQSKISLSNGNVQCHECRRFHTIPDGDVSAFAKDYRAYRLSDALDIHLKRSKSIHCIECDDENASLYCKTCKGFLCSNCTNKHKGKFADFEHDISSIEVIIEEQINQIDNCVKETNLTISKLEKRKRDVKEVRQGFERHKDDTIEKINKTIDDMKKSLDEAGISLLQRVKDWSADAEKKIENTLHKLRSEISSRTGLCSFAESLRNLEGEKQFNSAAFVLHSLELKNAESIGAEPIEDHFFKINLSCATELRSDLEHVDNVKLHSLSSWKTQLQMHDADEKKPSIVAELTMVDANGEPQLCQPEYIKCSIVSDHQRNYPHDAIEINRTDELYSFKFTPETSGRHRLRLTIGNHDFPEETFTVKMDPLSGKKGEVSCPYFEFDENTAHQEIEVSADRDSIQRIDDARKKTEEHLQKYIGAKGGIIFEPSATGTVYYEVQIRCSFHVQPEKRFQLFEIGLCPEEQLDKQRSQAFKKQSYCFSVSHCTEHKGLCWDICVGEKRQRHQFFSAVKVTAPVEKQLGFSFDLEQRILSIIDIEDGKDVSLVTGIANEDLIPFFGIQMPTDYGDVVLKLIAGRKVSILGDLITDNRTAEGKETLEGTNEPGRVIPEETTRNLKDGTESLQNDPFTTSFSGNDKSRQISDRGQKRNVKQLDSLYKPSAKLYGSASSATFDHFMDKLMGKLTATEERKDIQTILEEEFPIQSQIPKISDDLQNILELCLHKELSTLSSVILGHICEILRKREGEDCFDCYPAYMEGDKWNPSYILLGKTKIPKQTNEDLRRPLFCRRHDKVSREAAVVLNSKERTEKRLSKSEMENIKTALSKNSLTTSNSRITMVSACSVRSRKGGKNLTPEACVVVYCLLKGYIPFDEDPFPKNIEGIPVDVREGYCIFGMMPQVDSDSEMRNVPTQDVSVPKSSDSRHFNEKLLMGAGIGPAHGEIRGTLGGFVKLKDESMGFLTCAHLFKDNETLVSQPADDDIRHLGITKSFVCGEVITRESHPGSPGSIGVDAALVKITDEDRIPESSEFVDVTESELRFAGYDLASKPNFDGGKYASFRDLNDDERQQTVMKVGRQTGLTRGAVLFDGSFAKDVSLSMKLPGEDQTVHFYNQMEIEPIRQPNSRFFFDLGDSGALVFSRLKNELVCIGLAIGVTDFNTCIVTPIEEVLDRCGVQLYIFTEGSVPESMKMKKTSQAKRRRDDEDDRSDKRSRKKLRQESEIQRPLETLYSRCHMDSTSELEVDGPEDADDRDDCESSTCSD